MWQNKSKINESKRGYLGRAKKKCWFTAAISMGLIWPIEISFGLQFVRVEWLDRSLRPNKNEEEEDGVARDSEREKKISINRNENLCSDPSVMREWTQPFVIQPNYVNSKTVYLFSVPSARHRHTESSSLMPILLPIIVRQTVKVNYFA